MSFALIIKIICGIVCLIAVCGAIKKSNKPFKTAFVSAASGVCSLCVVNFLSFYTGVAIALNFTTSFVSVVLGVPGVICILLLNIII